MIETKKGIPVDITLEGNFVGSDPFFSEIQGTFTTCKGNRISVPGFYRGDGKWSVRFSSEYEGEWSYTITSPVITFQGAVSGIVMVKGEEPGITKLLRTEGTRFVTSSGEPVFLLGNECNFLFSLLASPGGFEKLQLFIKNTKEGGFNQVQINTYAYDYSYFRGRTGENDFGPAFIELWEKTPEGRRYNPVFFENFDKLIDYLHRNGIYAHVYLRVYNKYVDLPENYSEEDYAYYRLFVARYQAYPNVIWNMSKEGYFEPDKEYFFTMLNYVRSRDAYHHLCTIHDDLYYSFHERYGTTIDFLTVQQHYDLQYAHKYFVEKSQKPVICGESGMECPDTRMYDGFSCFTPERTCEIAYEAVMAGAYYQNYYYRMAWDVIDYDYKPKCFEYMARMRDFFAQFDLMKLKPVEVCAWCGECMDDGESTMLVYVEPPLLMKNYVNHLGRTLINVEAGRNILSCEAFGVYSGKKQNYDLLNDQNHVFGFDRDDGFCGKRGTSLSVFNSFPDEPTMFTVRYSLK